MSQTSVMPKTDQPLREKVRSLISDSDAEDAPTQALLAVRDHAGWIIEQGNQGEKIQWVYDTLAQIADYIKGNHFPTIWWTQPHHDSDETSKRCKFWLHENESGNRTLSTVLPDFSRQIGIDYQDGELVLIVYNENGEYDSLLRIAQDNIQIEDNSYQTDDVDPTEAIDNLVDVLYPDHSVDNAYWAYKSIASALADPQNSRNPKEVCVDWAASEINGFHLQDAGSASGEYDKPDIPEFETACFVALGYEDESPEQIRYVLGLSETPGSQASILPYR